MSCRLSLVFCLLTVCVAVSCQPSETRTFEVRGVVQEIKPDGKAAVIKHEAIAGYMDAMTMSFDAKTTNEFANVRAGDEVEFRLVVTTDDSWIERVKKTMRTMPIASAAPPAPAATNVANPSSHPLMD